MLNLPPLAIAALVWGVVFGASLLAMRLGSRLPEELRSADSRSTVSASMAVVGTLTAIALGLLLTVANSSFRDNQEQLLSTSSDLLRLEHLYRLYGADADGARDLLGQYARATSRDLFSPGGQGFNVENEATLDLIAQSESTAAELTPSSKTQQWLQPRMLDVADKIIQQHFALVRNKLAAIPPALIGLLVAWLVILFGSYALFAPRNLTSILALLLSSGAASGAILLIVELETPVSGFIYLGGEPLQRAVDVLAEHAPVR